MMNYPETPSAKTGSPCLVSPPFAFLKPPFPKVSLSDILISLTLFLDIRQKSLLKNHNFNDFTNFS